MAKIIEYNLEASECNWEVAPGRTVRGWGYNGQVPGPVLEANAGDTLVVRLTNHLTQATTIHWHGLRVPAAMDGTEVAQKPVQPGETFEYRFTLPDAGTFWYHPHANDTVQLERGLYGALIVRDPNDGVIADAEKILVLDDVKLDRSGEIAPFGGVVERHNRREGDVRLVNGKQEPMITLRAGQVERWRIIDASSARYIRLSLGGHPFTILGTDGGLLDQPYVATEFLLTPGKRIDIAVGPFDEGTGFSVEALRYNRMAGLMIRAERFATAIVGAPAPSRAALPVPAARVQRLVPAGSTMKPNRVVRLGVGMSLRRGIDFLINGEMHHHGESVKVGELQVWDVVNDSMMDHLPPARFLLPGAGAERGARATRVVGGHGKPSTARPHANRVAPRRPARNVDVSLPHPRALGGRDDGPL